MKRPQPLRRLQGAQGISHRTVVQDGCYTRNKSRQKKRRVQGVCFATMRHAPCAQVCCFIVESKEQSCDHDASMVNTERSVRVNTHGMVGGLTCARKSQLFGLSLRNDFPPVYSKNRCHTVPGCPHNRLLRSICNLLPCSRFATCQTGDDCVALHNHRLCLVVVIVSWMFKAESWSWKKRALKRSMSVLWMDDAV